MEEMRGRRWRGQEDDGRRLPVSISTATAAGGSRNRERSGGRGRWYCCFWEHRIMCFNNPLFRFGRARSSLLSFWFSFGVAFSIASLLAVSLILVWELGNFLHLLPSNALLPPSALLFGLSPSLFPASQGVRLSLVDAAYLFLSTCISVSVHEFGHAIAAASEGVPMEYIAVFLAVLFPGALVAFNSELLLALPNVAALRVYCAGIWHNAVFSAGCGLLLFLLPLLLWPFFMHGEDLMVLDVQLTSPLLGYLSPGDVIVSLDGKSISSEQEWMEMISQIHARTLQSGNHLENLEDFPVFHNGKGYCVPQFQSDNSFQNYLWHNQSTCPSGFSKFKYISCFKFNKLNGVSIEDGYSIRTEGTQCLNATDVIKHNKCGDGWATAATIKSKCSCAEGFTCMSPVMPPGLAWIEITYDSPFSEECLDHGRISFKQTMNTDFVRHACGGTFVFIGEAMSIGNSIQLTGYQPRWAFPFLAYLPTVLEKMLTCTFYTSLTIALLNSLPVFFLDGECILEATLCYFTFLGRRKRMKLLWACLTGGTLMSALAFARVFIERLL